LVMGIGLIVIKARDLRLQEKSEMEG
jgi:hypothetical protein